MRLAAALVCLLVLSCTKSQDKAAITKYHDNGIVKPAVAIAPIIDTSSFEITWSLPEELEQLLIDRFATKGDIFLSQPSPSFLLAGTENPFGNDLSWIKKSFASNEFVLFLELVEHDIVPLKIANDPCANLFIGVRIRIIDLRGKEPKLVLQELIREKYYISKAALPFDYRKTPWGTEEYTLSPIAMAHVAIIKTIADRATDYVLLAKSRWHG